MGTDRRPFVSVIVPVYNSEEWIEECLNSLIAQTFTDFEAILIDDGSTDAGGMICDAYRERDSRFRVVHRENGGLSRARNVGLENAHGEYIAFLDADDVFHPGCLETIQRAAEQTDADLIWWRWIEARTRPEFSSVDGAAFLPCTAEKMLWEILDDNGAARGYSWAKAFRRTLIGEVRYADGLLFSEDILFAAEVLAKSGLSCRCVGIDAELYWYRQHGGSITRLPFSEKRMDMLECRDRIYEALRAAGASHKLQSMVENDLLRYVCVFNKKLLLKRVKNRAGAFREVDRLYRKYRPCYRRGAEWTLKTYVYLIMEDVCFRLRSMRRFRGK